MSEQKDVSTDWQARSEMLERDILATLEMIDTQQRAIQAHEQLTRDLLDYIKEIAPYTYAAAPRCIKLQDRAAELGIVLEMKP